MSQTRPGLKISGVIVLTALLGAGAVLVVLKVAFPEAKARAYALGVARKQLGRDVRLKRIDIGLTGLRLQGLEISEYPDFAAGTFLKVENFFVRPSWKALLRRKLVVAGVSAEGLALNVVKNADGFFNYATLASAAAPGGSAKSIEAKTPAEFNVRHLDLAQGTVNYRDVSAATSWTVTGLALKLENFSFSAPFDLDVRLRAKGKAGGRPLDVALAFSGAIDAAQGARDKIKIEFQRLSAEQDGVKLEARGKISGLNRPHAEFDITLSAMGKTILAGKSVVRVLEPAANGERAIDADLRLKTSEFDLAGIAKLVPGIPAISLPPTDIAIVGRGNSAVASLQTLRVSWPGGTLDGAGSARGLGGNAPLYTGQVKFGVDLPEIHPGQYPFIKLPPRMGIPAMRLEGALAYGDGEIRIPALAAKFKQGTVSVSGVVRRVVSGKPEPELEIKADLDLPALIDKDLPVQGLPENLSIPPSRWNVDLHYAAQAIRLRHLGVKIASNELSVEGGITDPAGRAVFDLVVKCKRFVLEELTRMTPLTRDLKLTGAGFFALSVTGSKEKPVFGGKLQFKDLGAVVADLPLSGFTGTVSFDERRVDVPNLQGKLADGALALDLTIKDYATFPEIQLEATLDRFDLGQYLAASKKLELASSEGNARRPESPSARPLRTRGTAAIGALIHPNAAMEKVTASWDLYGVTPDMKKLTGTAKVNVGGGTLHAIGDMAAASPIVKVLLFPILIFQKIGRIGGIRLFPDFNDISVRTIVGDYSFKDGLMTLRRSELDSSAAQVSAVGTIDLSAETLDLTVTAQLANVAPIDVAVTGTMLKPKTNVKFGKFLTAPAKKLLEGFLKR